jgi:hypothetical protein
MDDQQEIIEQLNNEVFTLREDLRQVELMFYDPDWRRLTMQSEQDFTRDGLRQITELARIMEKANPIIHRGVEVQRLYVWAQGVSVQAKDPDINEVIQGFLDDERNKAALFGQSARELRETRLQTDGNMFIRFFINKANGRVRVSAIDSQEIQRIVNNPDDKNEPWFYSRLWTRVNLDGSQQQRNEAYPDWQYLPKGLFPVGAVSEANGKVAEAEIADNGLGLGLKIPFDVDWETPVYHVATNQMGGQWGLSEFFQAIAWARAYKTFLENLASVWQALARFAWELKVKGGKRGVAAAKTKLGTTASATSSETNPPPLTGSTFIAAEGRDLQPFKTAGATMSAEDGRRLFLMAVNGLPETFYGDVSVGTLATAKSLDRPTELKFINRQKLWQAIYQDIFGFVLKWAIKAPSGPLAGLGTVETMPDGDEVVETIVWNEDVDSTIMVSFPPIVEDDVPGLVDAWVNATTLKGQLPAGTFDLETVTRETAVLLGVDDIDQLIDELFPEDGSVTAEAEKVVKLLRKLEGDLQEAGRNGATLPEIKEQV